MKKCATCGELKPPSEYSWRNKSLGKKWGTCKACQRKQRKAWYQNNKEAHKVNTRKRKKEAVLAARSFVWNYLVTHHCVDCGESDPIVLEFDHVNGRKYRNITDMAGAGYSTDAILKEIHKTEVRCANCHRRKTTKERGWFTGS